MAVGCLAVFPLVLVLVLGVVDFHSVAVYHHGPSLCWSRR